MPRPATFHKKALVPHKKIMRIPSTLAHFDPIRTLGCDTDGGTGGDDHDPTFGVLVPVSPPSTRGSNQQWEPTG